MNRKRAFSLLEVLTATAVLALLVGLLLSIVTGVINSWQRVEGQRANQQSLRVAIERISSDLAAMLRPALETDQESFQLLINPPGLDELDHPTSAFWQATVSVSGVSSDIGIVGYFVRVRQDDSGVDTCLYRLSVESSGGAPAFRPTESWIDDAVIAEHAPATGPDAASLKGAMAHGIVGIWFTPYIGNDIASVPFDSRIDGFPTAIAVGLVALDPRTLQRVNGPSELAISSSTTSPEDFVNSLPAAIRQGAMILKTKISIAP